MDLPQESKFLKKLTFHSDTKSVIENNSVPAQG